jgi:hypothetical protein
MSSEQASVYDINNSVSATSVYDINNSVSATSVYGINNSVSATSVDGTNNNVNATSVGSLLDKSTSTGGSKYSNYDFYRLNFHEPTYDRELLHDEIAAAVERNADAIRELLIREASKYIPSRIYKYGLRSTKVCCSCKVSTNNTVPLLVLGQQICMKCYKMGKEIFGASITELVEGDSFEKEDFDALVGDAHGDAHGDALGDAPNANVNQVVQTKPLKKCNKCFTTIITDDCDKCK